MEKSIWTREYAVVLRLLKQMRLDAGLTQIQLAQKLHLTQSLWSKMERGELRVDVIQLRTVCTACGVSLPTFIEALEKAIAGRAKPR